MWLAVGYGVGIPIGYQLFLQDWITVAGRHQAAFVDRWALSPFIFSEFRRIPITIGHAGLLMLLYRSGAVNWLMKALAAVGQMAFTNYLDAKHSLHLLLLWLWTPLLW